MRKRDRDARIVGALVYGAGLIAGVVLGMFTHAVYRVFS